ncbi:hypothetical protein FD06_GL001262 [Apilactobacillus ozensis DSM 23829 = JCM 17196]|uniref:Uncharacterized protein n=1 Tax=Apilactobacillus ozensis DSM 23829 = JCM 17196 TaxID=1423781 RepID=A0A0R2AM38_9LACO|nr:hypothetical protein [Apilactobacillus ozensis]KRM68241.1 hypothetical protein FD06_GL001262 [Apilactobacillus ozensis DSM 23829 = JCM 17196]
MKYRYKILIQIAVLFFPFWLIIDGFIGLLVGNPFHPDVAIILGLLMTGIICLFNIVAFIIKLNSIGWHNIHFYHKFFFFFYVLLAVPSFIAWAPFL